MLWNTVDVIRNRNIAKIKQCQQLDVNFSGIVKGVVNCQNSRDKGPPEGNSARG